MFRAPFWLVRIKLLAEFSSFFSPLCAACRAQSRKHGKEHVSSGIKNFLSPFLFCLPVQVKNFTDVHPDYGARIQALLDKYNADSGKNVCS